MPIVICVSTFKLTADNNSNKYLCIYFSNELCLIIYHLFNDVGIKYSRLCTKIGLLQESQKNRDHTLTTLTPGLTGAARTSTATWPRTGCPKSARCRSGDRKRTNGNTGNGCWRRRTGAQRAILNFNPGPQG
jgi:hypothetical protein